MADGVEVCTEMNCGTGHNFSPTFPSSTCSPPFDSQALSTLEFINKFNI